MSLVICKNKPTEDVVVSEVSNINKPYAFRNSMTSNLEIPANSQIALQSAKINMDGSILVGEERKIFYYYNGPQIDPGNIDDTKPTNLENSPSYPLKVPLFEGSRLKRVTIYQIAEEIERSMNEVITSPNLKNRFTCDVKLNVGKFDGFSFAWGEDILGAGNTQYAPPAVATRPIANPAGESQLGMIEAGFTNIRLYQTSNGALGVAPSWIYTAVDGKFAINTMRGATRSAIGNVPPLNQKGGQAIFDITAPRVQGAAAGRCRCLVGLSRGSRSTYYREQDGVPIGGIRNNPRIRPESFRLGNGSSASRWFPTYFDYAVAYDPTTSSTAPRQGRLRILHSVVNSADTGGPTGNNPFVNRFRLKPQDIPYGDGTGGSKNTGADPAFLASANWDNTLGYDYTTNSLGIDKVIFTLVGGQVTITAQNSGTATDYVMIDYNAARNKEALLKCVNMNSECLLPLVALNNFGILDGTGNPATDNEVLIDRFDGVNSNWDDFNFLSDELSKNDWANRVYSSDLSALQVYRQLDQNRSFLNYSGVLALTKPGFTYPGAQITLGQVEQFTFKLPVIMPMPDMRYGGHNGMAVTDANTSLYLGFPNLAHIEGTLDGAIAGGLQFIDSVEVPTLISSKSVFVRIENLGQESVNAYQGLRSKIIAHLPRFDGVHNVGPLYLEPNNMIYIDLKNPYPIRINSFDVSLVYTDETYATNLTGTTIICLHIREKPQTSTMVN